MKQGKLKRILALSVTAGLLASPMIGLANDGGLGLTGEDEPAQESGLTGLVEDGGNEAGGLTGESGLTGEPGLESTTTDPGLLGDTNEESAFDTSLNETDSNTTPITLEEEEEDEPAFELTEAPETQEEEADEKPEAPGAGDQEDDFILELEDSEDDYVEEMQELPKTGFASSAGLIGLMGSGLAGMAQGFLKRKK